MNGNRAMPPLVLQALATDQRRPNQNQRRCCVARERFWNEVRLQP